MRTNKKPNVNQIATNAKLMVLAETVNRMAWLSKMGTYNGDRKIYEALGYPITISFTEYYARYERQDIAKAIIDRPVQASWKGEISVIENNQDTKTKFEETWEQLAYDHKLKSVFIRADKLTGIGRYSIILFGLDDVHKVADYAKPVSKKKKINLVYLRPLSEKSAKIISFETNPNNPRYGLPKYYEVNLAKKDTLGTGSSSFKTEGTIKVHYSRVLHIVEGILENEVYGTPRLRVVYNRLIDLDKIIGGDGEMYWRGARPGYTGNVDSEYQMSPEALEDLKKQIEDFEHNLKRVLINEGVEYKAFAQQIADPASHVDVQVQMISAVTGIPKRILVGSERGELSSAQDKQEWISYVTSRREEQNEPMILRPFIDKCMEIGILPKITTNIIVLWDKLFSLSDKEKVQIGKDRSMAIRDYIANPLSIELLPVEHFLRYILSLNENQIDEVLIDIDEDRLRETMLKSIESSKQSQLSGITEKTNDTDPQK